MHTTRLSAILIDFKIYKKYDPEPCLRTSHTKLHKPTNLTHIHMGETSIPSSTKCHVPQKCDRDQWFMERLRALEILDLNLLQSTVRPTVENWEGKNLSNAGCHGGHELHRKLTWLFSEYITQNMDFDCMCCYILYELTRDSTNSIANWIELQHVFVHNIWADAHVTNSIANWTVSLRLHYTTCGFFDL